MSSGPPILRFAPSPNGLLHRGHALSALTNRRFADRLGGRLLLRMEDIDPGRSRPEFERAIVEDLAWLGVAFDGSVRRQSEHMAEYAAALDALRARSLVYPCTCTRQEIARRVGEGERSTPWPRDPDGAPLYPVTCRQGAGDGAAAWRLDMPACLAAIEAPLRYRTFDESLAEREVVADPLRWGDAVVARKDVPTSYHLSVVVDDALQGITHVVRGRDLEAATDIHVLLQRLLGLPTPLYHFHPLILDETGEKLAKSRGSASLSELRAAGTDAAQLRAGLGF